MAAVAVLLRALLAAAAAATAMGLLHARDIDVDDDIDVDGEVDAPADADTMGIAAALDPELINTAGEAFHITVPGDYLMIGLPETLNLEDPDNARLMVTANFEKLTTSACEDLMIRSITMQGYVLGDNITTITVYIADDTFNSTAALGLDFVNRRSNGAMMTYSSVTTTEWGDYVPWCSIRRPRGFIHAPTRRSFRQRTRIFTMDCEFKTTKDGQVVSNDVTVHWSTAFRGVSGGESPVYANDLSLSISDVGATPAGLLGTDDHTDATVAVPGCNKAQPVGGPYQTRRVPKMKPWQRRYQQQKQRRQDLEDRE